MRHLAFVFVVGLTLAAANEHPHKLSDKDHYKVWFSRHFVWRNRFQGSEHDKNFDHEAFLGKETAHEFDELTPEKSKEKLA